MQDTETITSKKLTGKEKEPFYDQKTHDSNKQYH